MQKIMFEHRRFGLEQAVIARLKENTRRRVRFPKDINDEDVESAVMGIDKKGRVYFTFTVSTHWGAETVDVYPKYQIGEKVAVAQAYEDIDIHEVTKKGINLNLKKNGCLKGLVELKGWNNKMFVRADAMPHVIEITDIKAERLQDISDEDCIKEGLLVGEQEPRMYGFRLPKGTVLSFLTPREAFAVLIDRLNGRGTWERNEWQFAYTFKLIK